MKCLLIFSAFLVLVAAEMYDSKNDNIDIETLVGDIDTLRAFVSCFNDNGECTEISSDYKKDLSEAFQQACGKCTSPQKHMLKRFLEELKVKLPEENRVFLQKYDSQGKYLEPLQKAIAGF